MQKKNTGFVLLLLLICSFRLLHPDADPSLLKSTYDVCDEAWWAENARNMILHGTWFPGEYAGGIAVAPLYSLLLFLFFKAGGISLFVLRLVPVLASTGTVLVMYTYLNRFDGCLARTAALLLAINHSAFMYSRIGHLESTVLFFVVLSVYLFSLRRPGYMALSGAALAAAVLTKFSGVVFIPVAAAWCAYLLTRRRIAGKQVFIYVTGVCVPLLVYYTRWHLPHTGELALYFDYLQHTVYARTPGWNDFVARVAFFAQKEYFIEPSVLLLLVPAGAALLAGSSSGVESGRGKNEPFQLAAAWLAVYSVVILFTDFNTRRFVLLTVPLCILAGTAFATPPGRKTASIPVWLAWTVAFFLGFQGLSLHLNFHLVDRLYPAAVVSANREALNQSILQNLAWAYIACFAVIRMVAALLKKKDWHTRVLKLSVMIFFAVATVQAVVQLKTLHLLPDTLAATAIPALLTLLAGLRAIRRPGSATMRPLAAGYVLCCIFFTGNDLANPTFSLRQSISRIGKYDPGHVQAIAPPQYMELFLESPIKPLYYSVDDPGDPSILRRHAGLKPRLYATGYSGTDSLHYLAEKAMVQATLAADLHLEKSFTWFPDHPQPMQVFLFEIHYPQPATK